jgi:hypothetical protein
LFLQGFWRFDVVFDGQIVVKCAANAGTGCAFLSAEIRATFWK